MNQQKQEKILLSLRDDKYQVNDIFLTIQGEGPFSGRRSTFIRLAGCNLQCPQCDTEYTNRHLMTVDEICKAVADDWQSPTSGNPLIVITGGEPFRQPIGRLIKRLVKDLYPVQIETNGSTYQEGPWSNRDVTLVCSPKLTKLDKKIIPHIRHYKYVVDADHIDPKDGLPTSVLGYGFRPARPLYPSLSSIYVSPADVKDPIENERNKQAAVRSCMDFGYTLSLQTHKLLGLK